MCCFLCWTCVCYLSFLYLGMLVLCGYLLVMFGTCVCYLRFLHLGMSVVCLLVHLGFGFLFLIWGFCFVFILICSLVFFTCDSCFTWEMFLLLVTLLCLVVFTWACPSVSCRLWVFSMGRICIAILAQVTHVWLIVSFLVGSNFGLVGIETFVQGLGLPLAWSTAVLDVLLLLFSVFFCKSNLHWFLMHCLCTFLHLLRNLSTLLLHFWCNLYALFFWHFLCVFFLHLFYAFLCNFYALFMHFLYTFYALFMRV